MRHGEAVYKISIAFLRIGDLYMASGVHSSPCDINHFRYSLYICWDGLTMYGMSRKRLLSNKSSTHSATTVADVFGVIPRSFDS